MKYAMDEHFKLNISKCVLIVITLLLANILAAYNLQIRAREADLKKCYRVLKEVHKQLKNTTKDPVRTKYIQYYITVYIVLEFVLTAMYAKFVSRYRQSGFLRYTAFIHFAHQYIQVLIIIRFTYFIRNILVGLEMVNKSLKIIYGNHFNHKAVNPTVQSRRYLAIEVRRKNFVSGTVHGNDPTEYAIRNIALSYSKLCQLIYFINDKDGTSLLWLTVYMTLNVIMSMYNLLLEITNVDKGETAIFLPTMWLIFTTTRLVLLTEQCHRIHEQMGNTSHHLSQLKCFFGDTNVAVVNELDLFQRLIMLRRPTFSPQDMFTLTRTFCTKVIGAVITIVVIIVTYGKEVKALSESE